MVTECTPGVFQVSHALQVGLPGFVLFPLRSAIRTVDGPPASIPQSTRRYADAAPGPTALERNVPLWRSGKTRETSSTRTSTVDAVVLSAATSTRKLTS